MKLNTKYRIETAESVASNIDLFFSIAADERTILGYNNKVALFKGVKALYKSGLKNFFIRTKMDQLLVDSSENEVIIKDGYIQTSDFIKLFNALKCNVTID